MHSGLKIAVVAAIAVLLGALAWTATRNTAEPTDPARQAIAACTRPAARSARSCYQSALNDELRAHGPGAAMALLGRLAALDPDVRRDGHMHAHMIGIAALSSTADVGRVFPACGPAFESGCYHGVIQAWFLAARREGRALDGPALDAVCASWRGPGGNAWLMFQCTHGLGHGLTMFHGHDLRLALAGCDLMRRPGERESCYGGAFMENIVNVTEPHHMADAGAAGGHGHHAHAQAGPPAADPWRPLDPNDLHYPCSAMAEKYLDGCYTIQTAAMLHFTNDDVGRTARECARAPARVRGTCFVSLGRGISTLAAGNARRGVALCALAAPEFQPDCNVGVVQSVVNMNADPIPGVAYCRAVTPGLSKTACYSVVGRASMLLADGAARRESACRRAEAEFVETCLGRSEAAAWGGSNEATVSARRPARATP